MINLDVIRFPAQAIKKALKKFKTPFFLYEEERIIYWCRQFKDAFRPLFPGFTPLFAVKANSNPHILKIIADQSWGFDCSSYSEVWQANKLNVFAQHTGNYTTEEELKYVLDSPNVLLNLDDVSQLETVKKLGIPEYLSFRINPGIASATMENNLFAGPDAKYGVPWENAVEAYKKAKETGVKRFGIHMMTGSNVTEQEYFGLITKKLLEIAGTVYKELGIEFEYLNIGGGFNVPYRPDEPTFDLKAIAQDVRGAFDETIPKYGFKEPKLMIEPGRRITCDAGFLVGNVTVIKDSYKKFAGLNVSTNAMPRTAFYDAYHHVSVLDKNPKNGSEKINIVGSICENNDQWAKNRNLPPIEVGDTMIIHNCGAHALAMSHNYNGKLKPAEILLKSDGTLKIIRRAETVEDLMKTVVL